MFRHKGKCYSTYLFNPIIFCRVEEPQPIQNSTRIASRIQKVKCQKLCLRSESSKVLLLNPTNLRMWCSHLLVWAIHLQNIVPYAMDVLRTRLDKTVRHRLHQRHLFLPRHPNLGVMVPEYGCPWYFPVRYSGREFCENGSWVP